MRMSMKPVMASATFAGLLCCAVALAPLAALAADEEESSWDSLREQLYEGRVVHDGSDFMTLKAPSRALDAAIVPVSLSFGREQKDDDYITSVLFLIDENPAPVAATFTLSPHNGRGHIETRLRVDRYSYVRAIAEDNDGELYMVAKYVKGAGGCSAPSLSDMEAAMARLGRMKFKFKGVDARGLSKAQLLISHPNYSGLQFNSITRSEIPAHFVDSVTVRQGERTLLQVESGISISENPAFTFKYEDSGTEEPIIVKVTDTDGGEFGGSWSAGDDMPKS